MKKILLLSFVACIAITSATQAQDNKLTKKEQKEGWKLLFDGVSTKGWHTYNTDTVGRKWKVADGAIYFDQPDNSGGRKGGGDLTTDGEYENYELNLEWKVAKGSNSGIIFDIQEDKNIRRATWQTGPEMQVLDNIDAEDNKKQNHLAGCLYDMAGDASVSHPKPVGEWNKVRLIQNKGHLEFYLNGTKTFEGTIGSEEWNKLIANSKFNGPAFANFAKVAKGHIAIQEHPGQSFWKNMKIREIKD